MQNRTNNHRPSTVDTHDDRTPDPCGDWNDQHDCTLPSDHRGNHRCGGCGDAWNRWAGETGEDEGGFFAAQRDREWPNETRCVSRSDEAGEGNR